MYPSGYGPDLHISDDDFKNYVCNEIEMIRRELQRVSTEQYSLQPKMMRTADGDSFSLENLVLRLAEQSGLTVKIKSRHDGDDFDCSPQHISPGCPRP